MQGIIKHCQRRAEFLRVKLYVLWLRLFTALRYQNKSQRKTEFKRLRYLAEKKYLSRYLYVVTSEKNTSVPAECPKIIWTCWWQGKENLPPVVKRCIESIRKYCPEYELRIITADNIRDYIELPDYIMQKHQKGYIPRAHLADILRVALLVKYGGIWMDATVFLTAPLPQFIADSPFFAFHCHDLYQFQIWFIKAAAANPLMKNLLNLLLEYWKYENSTINYFFGYSLFDLMVENSAECAKQWAQTPLIYDDCYELADNFFAPYSAQKWAAIKAKTSIHKLSWKYKKMPESGTFLARLLDGETED
ncbi:MAG: capsular polysaccharide synthesis protein [Alphaproteobacteria bacterium]|nr:capsular polysaccharide synthesis protein [Alphaproteobacteria bacterium]